MPKEFKISDKTDQVEQIKDTSVQEDLTTEKSEPTKEQDIKAKIDSNTPEEKKETTLPENEKNILKDKKRKNKIKKSFNWKTLIFPTVATLTLVGIGLFYYFGIYKVKPVSPSEILSFNTNFISSTLPVSAYKGTLELLSQPEEPRTEESPLNGLLFTQTEMDTMMNRRPVAVMVNNHASTRPQSGLNSADIVIEANVESGITRYMAIFWSEGPEKVGSIRSMRQYYLEWLSEYDPIVIHDGCASSDDPRVNACGNIYTYGIKDIATIGAWRWDDGVRYSPHNEYSSVAYAWEYGEKMSWDEFPSTIESWEFKKDADTEDRGEKTKVELTFHQRLDNGGLYNATWTYDSATNSYLRNVGGSADIDQETNTQITAKNVIIQEVEMTQTYDDKSHLIIETISSGDAVFLIDGNITYGSWKKTSRTDRTMYYDSSGNEMVFNRGRIWISMIPHSDGKFDIIEQ